MHSLPCTAGGISPPTDNLCCNAACL
jgi:hypothetical protein